MLTFIYIMKIFILSSTSLFINYYWPINFEYVFITQYNEPYKNSHVLDTLFKNLCTKSNLRVGRFYDTKKFFCTFAEENINNETWLTQQVGHEDIQVTRNHYIGKVKIDFSKIENVS